MNTSPQDTSPETAVPAGAPSSRWGKPQPRLTAAILSGAVMLFVAGWWVTQSVHHQVNLRAEQLSSDYGAVMGLQLNLGQAPGELSCEQIEKAVNTFSTSAESPEVLSLGFDAVVQAVEDGRCPRQKAQAAAQRIQERLDAQPWALKNAAKWSRVWRGLTPVAEDHARVRQSIGPWLASK